MSIQTFWDFKVKVKNFSAKTAMDSRDYKMLIYDDNIIYRRGKFNNDDITIDNIDNYMFYNVIYVDLKPSTSDSEQINMMDWFQTKKSTQYSIIFKNSSSNILDGTIRFYNISDAFSFRMYFNDYIIFDKNEEKTTIVR